MHAFLSENLMSFTFCILPISGSTWHCKEGKESKVKEEVIWGLKVGHLLVDLGAKTEKF